MTANAMPHRKFLIALYDIAGDHAKRHTPFGDVAQLAGLGDREAHAAFATLRQGELVTCNSDGCVALTDAGRKAARGPEPRKARPSSATAAGAV